MRWVQPQHYAIGDPGAWLSTWGSQLNYPSPHHLCMPHHMTDGVLNTPNKLCPALISLVFLHTFFGLAQFCKKPCNLVFNVLHELFKRSEDQSIRMFFITNDLRKCLASRRKFQSQDLPCRSYGANHCHTIRPWRGRFIFLIHYRHKFKKGNFFKTLRRQNSAVLSRAALSGP